MDMEERELVLDDINSISDDVREGRKLLSRSEEKIKAFVVDQIYKMSAGRQAADDVVASILKLIDTLRVLSAN